MVLTLAASQASTNASQQEYAQPKQGYSLQLPSEWVLKEKAGADVLFQDPLKGSTSVGVTVAPVRVKTIADFGDLDSVGEKLLKAEKDKVRPDNCVG